MPCRKYQFMIGTEDEATLAANQDLQAHLSRCPHCVKFLQEMRALASATRGLFLQAAPSGFGERVAQRVRQTPQVTRESLLGRLIGPLRAPVPAFQTRHVLAAVALVLVAIVVLAVLVHPVGTTTASPTVTTPTLVQPGGGQPVNYQGAPKAPAKAPVAPARGAP